MSCFAIGSRPKESQRDEGKKTRNVKNKGWLDPNVGETVSMPTCPRSSSRYVLLSLGGEKTNTPVPRENWYSQTSPGFRASSWLWGQYLG